MARVPLLPEETRQPRRPDTSPVIKPEGRFIRERKVRALTDRSPRSVTRIRPEEREPILPEMPYIPPA